MAFFNTLHARRPITVPRKKNALVAGRGNAPLAA
jgi:hypothetical protein